MERKSDRGEAIGEERVLVVSSYELYFSRAPGAWAAVVLMRMVRRGERSK
jgi:hypothetical protein